MSDASISNARNMVIKLTGTLAGNREVKVPDNIEKFYIVQDATTHGSFSLTFKTVSGSGFTLTQGLISAAFSDGTNITAVNLDTLSGTIGTAQIADDSITTAKILNNNVTSDKILDSNVGTDKIADGAVVEAKLGNDAVTAAKLQRKFTISTSSPSGGSDGDIWFKYS